MDIEKIIENKKLTQTIKIIISSVISVALAIIIISNINIKKIKEQNTKISVTKTERTNYPNEETIWAILEIPTLKIKTNVYKGDDKLLNYGAIHHKESYFPGDGGTILIAVNNEYLKNIQKLKENDKITLRTMYKTYSYKVEKIRKKSEDEFSNSLEINSNEEKLIFYTTNSKNTKERFVVFAK